MKLAIDEMRSMWSRLDVSVCKRGCGLEKVEYLLESKVWKCCMSDEDESATVFVMQ